VHRGVVLACLVSVLDRIPSTVIENVVVVHFRLQYPTLGSCWARYTLPVVHQEPCQHGDTGQDEDATKNQTKGYRHGLYMLIRE
jgi:hypothetical protein